MFLASRDLYGADKRWCLFKPVPIDVDADAAGSSAQHGSQGSQPMDVSGA